MMLGTRIFHKDRICLGLLTYCEGNAVACKRHHIINLLYFKQILKFMTSPYDLVDLSPDLVAD
jgi:hypothetical protein